MISALFQPGDEEPSGRGALLAAVSSQEGGHGDDGGRLFSQGQLQRQQAEVAVQDIARRSKEPFVVWVFTVRDGAGTSTLGDLPTLEQPHLVGSGLGWRLYWVSSRVLFQRTFFKDSLVLLCLKLTAIFYWPFHRLFPEVKELCC